MYIEKDRRSQLFMESYLCKNQENVLNSFYLNNTLNNLKILQERTPESFYALEFISWNLLFVINRSEQNDFKTICLEV